MMRLIFFTQSTDSNDNSFQKHPLQTDSEIMFYQRSGHPFAQSSGYIKLTVRVTIDFQLCLVSPLVCPIRTSVFTEGDFVGCVHHIPEHRLVPHRQSVFPTDTTGSEY